MLIVEGPLRSAQPHVATSPLQPLLGQVDEFGRVTSNLAAHSASYYAVDRGLDLVLEADVAAHGIENPGLKVVELVNNLGRENLIG